MVPDPGFLEARVISTISHDLLSLFVYHIFTCLSVLIMVGESCYRDLLG